MDEATYRALVFDAAKGLDAVLTFIETRFELADMLDENGEHELAELAREAWTGVWAALNGEPRVALAQEVYDILQPEVPDDALVDG